MKVRTFHIDDSFCGRFDKENALLEYLEQCPDFYRHALFLSKGQTNQETTRNVRLMYLVVGPIVSALKKTGIPLKLKKEGIGEAIASFEKFGSLFKEKFLEEIAGYNQEWARLIALFMNNSKKEGESAIALFGPLVVTKAVILSLDEQIEPEDNPVKLDVAERIVKGIWLRMTR